MQTCGIWAVNALPSLGQLWLWCDPLLLDEEWNSDACIPASERIESFMN